MAPVTRHGGPIDPHSAYDLHDLVDGAIPVGESTEFYGFHLISGGDPPDASITVQYDGHVGEVARLYPDEYGDVLEVVAELVDLLIEFHERDEMGRIEMAGKYLTHEQAKANAEPERYTYLPRREELDDVEWSGFDPGE